MDGVDLGRVLVATLAYRASLAKKPAGLVKRVPSPSKTVMPKISAPA